MSVQCNRAEGLRLEAAVDAYMDACGVDNQDQLASLLECMFGVSVKGKAFRLFGETGAMVPSEAEVLRETVSRTADDYVFNHILAHSPRANSVDDIIHALKAATRDCGGSFTSLVCGGVAGCHNGMVDELKRVQEAAKVALGALQDQADATVPLKKAKDMLEAAKGTKDAVERMKKLVAMEAALAAKLENAQALEAAKAAGKELHQLMQAFLVLAVGSVVDNLTMRQIYDVLAEDAKMAQVAAAVATKPAAAPSGAGAAGEASGGGRQVIQFGGRRVGSFSGADVTHMASALLAGDVRMLSMLDMADADLTQHERMAVANAWAATSGSKGGVDAFRAAVVRAVGEDGAAAVVDAGLL